ncbi:MAG TPA: FAD:protein FMN transferase [Pseudonocardia sp.]
MTSTLTEPGRLVCAALGTSAVLLVTDRTRLAMAAEQLHAELAEIDLACSRFREDSEISALHRSRGAQCTVSPVLADALDAALRAAELTDGLVDPTVGASVRGLGYDRDFDEVLARPAGLSVDQPRPAPGWWRVGWDSAARQVVVPAGIVLDLGATAKALAADRAARRAASAAGCGVLVSLGGDIATEGEPPEGGWLVAIADDHRAAMGEPAQTVALSTGALATSSTEVRSWWRGGTRRHHIVDPRTGLNPAPVWRTVTVAADCCLDANVASTAAIVLGAEAPGWLTTHRLPARLVTPEGAVERTEGWPVEGRRA